MISINTNMPSLIAQRSLNNSTKLLNQAIERMTTGFKINHASDNAANFSITTNMSTKISSYEVAEDNVAMGLDLLSTADGSLDLISDKLTRLRALAEQAANGTYGEQSLNAINVEANAIVDEIERIYSTAEYNGIKLFDGEPQFLKEVQKRDTSSMTKLSSVSSTTAITSGTYSISTAEELAKLSEMSNKNLIKGGEFVLADNIDLSAYSSGEGWTPIDSRLIKSFDGNGYIVSNLTIHSDSGRDAGLFRYISSVQNLGLVNVDIETEGSECVGAISGGGSSFSNCFVIGRISNSTNGETQYNFLGGLCGQGADSFSDCYFEGSLLTKNKGKEVLLGSLVGDMDSADTTFTNCYADAIGSDGTKIESFYNGAGSPTITGEASPVQIEKIINLQVGIDSTTASQISFNSAIKLNVSSLRGIGKGGNYLSQIDNLINTVSGKQTELGAIENRLESALEEISTQYDNLVSSRSTLRDADIAEVSSEYIRQQILQQASATLLATANQSPALALQLL